MQTAAWLAAPYLSALVICRTLPVVRRVAKHVALTLAVGWIAVLALMAAVLRVWSPPVAFLAVFASLSGLAMLTAGPRRGDDDSADEDDDEPPPVTDWDAFDAARSGWARPRRPRPVGTR
jgi:hypothetical protein